MQPLFLIMGLFLNYAATAVTVTVHRAVRCPQFGSDRDSRLERFHRNNPTNPDRASVSKAARC